MSGPSKPRRSRIAHFKVPFVVGMASAVSLGLACGGDGGVDGETDSCVPNVPCNPPSLPPPPAGCGTSPAEIGRSCAGHLGLTCSYDYCSGTAPMRQCSAVTGLWVDIPVPGCNPDTCHSTLPIPGSDCTVPDSSCEYPGACSSPSTAVCRAGQWLVTYSSGPACNPPAVVPVCPERELVTGEDCVYEGQACLASCEPGAESRSGHLCSGLRWQAAVVSCPPSDRAPDAGAADGGATDAGAPDAGS